MSADGDIRSLLQTRLGWDVMRFRVYQLRDEMPVCTRVKSWRDGQ
jgi:hypothetical protein